MQNPRTVQLARHVVPQGDSIDQFVKRDLIKSYLFKPWRKSKDYGRHVTGILIIIFYFCRSNVIMFNLDKIMHADFTAQSPISTTWNEYKTNVEELNTQHPDSYHDRLLQIISNWEGAIITKEERRRDKENMDADMRVVDPNIIKIIEEYNDTCKDNHHETEMDDEIDLEAVLAFRSHENSKEKTPKHEIFEFHIENIKTEITKGCKRSGRSNITEYVNGALAYMKNIGSASNGNFIN